MGGPARGRWGGSCVAGRLSRGDSQVEMPLRACTCVCQEARVRCSGSDYSHELG